MITSKLRLLTEQAQALATFARAQAPVAPDSTLRDALAYLANQLDHDCAVQAPETLSR